MPSALKKHAYNIAVLLLFSAVFWSLPSYFEQSEVFQRLTLVSRDLAFIIRHNAHNSPSFPNELNEIVIVTVDEESCERLNARWPWSRKVFAEMIDQLRLHGAKLVGFSMTFTGLEDGGMESTEALAKAMREHGNVIVGERVAKNGAVIKPEGLIEGAASRIGFFGEIEDADQTKRRSYLVSSRIVRGLPGDASYSITLDSFESSFPLQLIAGYSGPEKINEPRYDRALGLVSVGTSPRRGLAVEEDGSYMINYIASESDFARIPAWKIVQGKISDSDVRNKTVLVGLASSLLSDTSAASAKISKSDIHPTPLGSMPGVIIQANELLAALSNRLLKFIPDEFCLFLSWVAGLCVLALYLTRRLWIGFFGSVVSCFGFFLGVDALIKRDYIIEPFLLFTGTVVATGIGFAANSLSLLLENRGLETKAIHDKLTGLYKYEYLRECLEEEWKRCARAKLPVSIVMTDLDHFKQINDTLGHEAGNQMIKNAARVVQQSARRYDVVSRYGGDEFVVLLWHSNRQEAEAYRGRLRNLYQEMVKKLAPEFQKSSISIGVASFDPSVNADYPPDTQRLIEDADKDLFLDKESRRRAS